MHSGLKRRVNGRAILIAPIGNDMKRIDEIVSKVRDLKPKTPKSTCTEVERQQFHAAIAQYRVKLARLSMSPRPTRTNVAQFLVRLGADNFSFPLHIERNL